MDTSYKIDDFTQSQSHGLFWDNEIREKVFEIPSCKNDTKKYDIDSKDNKFDPIENISIKTSCNNNIDCGDIIRFFNEDFQNKYTIILIRYNQLTQDTKKIKEIIELEYNLELKNYLFGTIDLETLSKYVQIIKSIPHGIVSNEIKNNYKNVKKQMQKNYNMNINISPKVDSKSQRRVQCSIPKIDNILELFPNNILSRTKNAFIREVEISSEIKSKARKRSKKSIL